MPQPLLRPEDPMAGHISALYDRVARLERRPIASGGFDPLEDPVILGANGASLTADASNVTGGATGYAVAINGRANGIGSVAVGPGQAYSDYSVAIGNAVVNSGSAGGIAQGNAAQVTGADGIATGSSAAVLAAGGIAHGKNTTASHVNSVALAPGASTTKASQIMLGSTSHFTEIPGNGVANGLVFKDTVSGFRYILQVTSGALVLNTAP